MKSYKVHVQEKLTEDEWFIVENTHEAISTDKLEQISEYLSDWNNIDITDKRFVLDGLIYQIKLTSDNVIIEWKI